MSVFASVKAFFTSAEHKVEADVGEIHAVLTNLARRVETLEQKVGADAKAAVADVVADVAKVEAKV